MSFSLKNTACFNSLHRKLVTTLQSLDELQKSKKHFDMELETTFKGICSGGLLNRENFIVLLKLNIKVHELMFKRSYCGNAWCLCLRIWKA